LTTYTPMMRQYLKIKEKHKDSILFFRMGDFYEMFFEDAKIASKVLEITLTARTSSKEKIPMCGIPYHAGENYIAKLIKNGFKVAVCEQTQDPKFAKGIVKREVTRYITPGTALSDSMLEAKTNNYLASIYKHKNNIGFSFIDLSTGEFKVTEFKDENMFINEFDRISPAECIIPTALELPENLKLIIQNRNVVLTKIDDWLYSVENCKRALTELFKIHSLDGFGFKNMDISVISAGIIIVYLKQMHGRELSHINKLTPYFSNDYMILDSTTQRNLEILNTISGETKSNTLFSVIDKTVTSMGGRLFKKWITQPLCEIKKINNRLDAVEELKLADIKRHDLRNLLKEISDIERIISRIDSNIANARDLISLSSSIKIINQIKKLLNESNLNILKALDSMLIDLTEIAVLIEKTIVEEPPFSIREGGFIKKGVNEELDEVSSIKKDGKSWLVHLQEQESKRSGIKSLKVKYNKVFGYYIEITNSNLNMVPDNYIRKQTLVNCERYITPELKEKESLILGADERICKLELDIFNELIKKIMQYTKDIQKTAVGVANLDSLQGLAEIAVINGYSRPVVNTGNKLFIKDGRHPVVEKSLNEDRFIPNDTNLSMTENQIAIITGPNMAGKSTYIRQVALISLLAQIGSFVPAKQYEAGIVDRIFTRVGAADELARGQSTFMLEMNETSNILNNATKKSLIILDEVGRGTSTVDGVSIAWAISEYIHDNIGARTLFATHYHELTELENIKERIRNYRIDCKEWKDSVIFLRKIVEGGTDKSYGIHVAGLAGIPQKVIKRAKEILLNLETEAVTDERRESFSKTIEYTTDISQTTMFEERNVLNDEFIKDLEEIDINNLTPIEAFTKLVNLKEKYEVKV
jgi:DNA mismatch repair protein MutS